ncbi:hypothetical protein DICPUDRAFT_158352 [Dictyostelium purpureum]|uniref:Uncharacterized protein n=1 Tax=Dictyostelium purpureum TaxID=5786 RepID=F1A1E4_DICPU|nr:uncharacterized protein DICPUDRAFT_158352 [Dictyostelium purpureum]EGC29988.1 hypothetical protein DICPUDRAFT_158352 [Dictyostelium purpureum]|eukprot:XP_003293491.1 hypothetical protein DICPUDRAFT_158352 [Dictyostelium purpureum]
MAFGKTKKYKKIVKTIFPSQPNGEMQLGNISKLTYFCEMNPEQLQKVGPYIENKAQNNLNKKRLSYVETCAAIIRELIIGCRNHLSLFSGNATRLMKLLLNQNEHPHLQIEATETFIRFASVQDDASQIPPEIDEFIKYFINMAKNMNTDDSTRRKIRGEGLKGVTAYVSISHLVDDLDTFITKHTDIIYTILDNMQYKDQIPSPNISDRNLNVDDSLESGITNVRALATECLRDLARRVDNITVDSLVTTVVNYLDSHQKWNVETFSVHALTSISQSIKPQHYTIMLTSFLRHLELDHSPSVTKEIVRTAVSIVNDSTASINMVITSLLKLLIRSLEISTKHLPDVDEQLKLQNSIIDSIGAIGKKSKTTPKKFEIMNQIMNTLRDIIKPNTQQNLIDLFSVNLIQCVAQVSSNLNDLISPNPMAINELTRKLIDLSNEPSTNNNTRKFIQETIQSFLIPGIKFDQLIQGGVIFSNDGVEEYLNNNSAMIRNSIINEFANKTNQPENIIALYKTLVILLFRGRGKELQYSIPMIFQLQNQQSPNLPLRLNRSINLAIASYLLLVSKLFKWQELENYISTSLNQRFTNNNQCRYLTFDFNRGGLVISNTQKHLYSDLDQEIVTTLTTTTVISPNSVTKTTESVTETIETITTTSTSSTISSELIDQDRVIEILCQVPTLTGDFPDLKKLLSGAKESEINRNNDTFTIITTTAPSSASEDSIDTPPMKLPVLAKSRESIVLSTSIPNHFQKSLNFDSFKQFVNYFDESNQNSNSNTTPQQPSSQQNQNSNLQVPQQNQQGSTNGSTNGFGKGERNNISTALFDLNYELTCSKISETQHTNKEYLDLMEILTASEQTFKTDDDHPIFV